MFLAINPFILVKYCTFGNNMHNYTKWDITLRKGQCFVSQIWIYLRQKFRIFGPLATRNPVLHCRAARRRRFETYFNNYTKYVLIRWYLFQTNYFWDWKKSLQDTVIFCVQKQVNFEILSGFFICKTEGQIGIWKLFWKITDVTEKCLIEWYNIRSLLFFSPYFAVQFVFTGSGL